MVNLREDCSDVWQDKEVGIVDLRGQPLIAFVGQFHAVQFLVDHEIEWVGSLMHTAVVVLHIDLFCGEHASLDAWFGEELDERFVLW